MNITKYINIFRLTQRLVEREKRIETFKSRKESEEGDLHPSMWPVFQFVKYESRIKPYIREAFEIIIF